VFGIARASKFVMEQDYAIEDIKIRPGVWLDRYSKLAEWGGSFLPAFVDSRNANLIPWRRNCVDLSVAKKIK